MKGLKASSCYNQQSNCRWQDLQDLKENISFIVATRHWLQTMGLWAPPTEGSKPCPQLVPGEKHITGLPQQRSHPPAMPRLAVVSLHLKSWVTVFPVNLLRHQALQHLEAYSNVSTAQLCAAQTQNTSRLLRAYPQPRSFDALLPLLRQ